jgi:hypothetical protein
VLLNSKWLSFYFQRHCSYCATNIFKANNRYTIGYIGDGIDGTKFAESVTVKRKQSVFTVLLHIVTKNLKTKENINHGLLENKQSNT